MPLRGTRTIAAYDASFGKVYFGDEAAHLGGLYIYVRGARNFSLPSAPARTTAHGGGPAPSSELRERCQLCELVRQRRRVGTAPRRNALRWACRGGAGQA